MVAQPVGGNLFAVGHSDPTFIRVLKADPRPGDEVVCVSDCGRLVVCRWSPSIAAAAIVGVVRGRIVEG